MKKSITIYQTKNLSLSVKNYSFTAELDQNLLLKHLKALGLISQPELCTKIEGEFSIEWDDDIPMPQIDALYIIGPDNTKHIEIDLDRCYNSKVLLFDGYAIEELISERDNGDWSQDRIEAAADRAYDAYKDSLLEE